MALLATEFTIEFILLVIGLVLFDGGIIRKIGAIGLFTLGLQLSYSRQAYVSDLTSTPVNVFLFLTPDLQNALVIMFAILDFITLAWTLIIFGRIISAIRHGIQLTWNDYEDFIV